MQCSVEGENGIEAYVAGYDRCWRHQCELLAGGVMVSGGE